MKLILLLCIGVLLGATILGEWVILKYFYPLKPNQLAPEPTPFAKIDWTKASKGSPEKTSEEAEVETVDTHSTCFAHPGSLVRNEQAEAPTKSQADPEKKKPKKKKSRKEKSESDDIPEERVRAGVTKSEFVPKEPQTKNASNVDDPIKKRSKSKIKEDSSIPKPSKSTLVPDPKLVTSEKEPIPVQKRPSTANSKKKK